MSDVNAALAAAGRAGFSCFHGTGHMPLEPTVDEYTDNALAVLKELGLWDGETWEWRVTWAAGFNWKASLTEVQARDLHAVEGGKLQRRPKITSPQWEDVDD